MGRDKYKKEYTRIGVYSFVVLFKIVFEIVGYFLHEVNSTFAHHIVLGARIDEIIDWDILSDTCIKKIERMLIENNIVDKTLTDEKFAFEISSLIHQRNSL